MEHGGLRSAGGKHAQRYYRTFNCEFRVPGQVQNSVHSIFDFCFCGTGEYR